MKTTFEIHEEIYEKGDPRIKIFLENMEQI
jgi:hypothetical protein